MFIELAGFDILCCMAHKLSKTAALECAKPEPHPPCCLIGGTKLPTKPPANSPPSAHRQSNVVGISLADIDGECDGDANGSNECDGERDGDADSDNERDGDNDNDNDLLGDKDSEGDNSEGESEGERENDGEGDVLGESVRGNECDSDNIDGDGDRDTDVDGDSKEVDGDGDVTSSENTKVTLTKEPVYLVSMAKYKYVSIFEFIDNSDATLVILPTSSKTAKVGGLERCRYTANTGSFIVSPSRVVKRTLNGGGVTPGPYI